MQNFILWNILKVNNKDTRTMSGTSIVNFEHISHSILLEFKQIIQVGSEKL